jgi:uncharacterized protein (DUF736 family)
MADFDNNMRGVLFPNKEKKSEKSPDYSGSAEVNGVEYRLAGWKRTSKSGLAFLSIAFSDKDERPGKPAPADDENEPF